MLTLFIIIFLAISFYTGYRRGLLMQAIRVVGYVATFILANRYVDTLAGFVEMWIPFPSIQMDTELALYDEATSFAISSAFYRVITFLLILFIGWLLTNFLSLLFTKVMYYDVLNQFNGLGGGILNVLIAYVGVFLVLFVLSLIPIEFIQQQFVDNPLAYWIVANTPILSSFAQDAWLQVSSISFAI